MNLLRVSVLISICLAAQLVSAGKRRLRKLEASVDMLCHGFHNLTKTQEATETRLDDIDAIIEELKNDRCPKSELPKNCIDIYQRNPESGSGYYNISTNEGEVIEVYCDRYGTRGYMFLSRGALPKLGSLDGLYTITDHAVIRVLYNDGGQHDVKVAQIAKYQFQFALSFQISKADGYKLPMNDARKPYVYLGFIPKEIALLKTKNNQNPKHGYKAGVQDIVYANCDRNPNSYIAFFGNDGNVTEHERWKTGGDNVRMRAWFVNDEIIPASRYIREDDFFFYEMHMGGCGGYITSTLGDKYGVRGATLGLGFDIRPRC